MGSTLDPNHWTAKLQAAWTSAAQLAAGAQHSETTPLHLALALLDDSQGLARQVRTQSLYIVCDNDAGPQIVCDNDAGSARRLWASRPGCSGDG